MRRCNLGLCAVVLMLSLTCLSAQAAPQRSDAYRYIGSPSAPQYPLPVDAARLNNTDKISQLSSMQTAGLIQNGFVVIPDDAIQMFYLYENYPDAGESPTPNFITVDSLLHAYHLFFDFSLRQVETKYLVPACLELSKLCAFHNDKFSNKLPDGPLKEAARANVIYFSIAWSLIAGQEMTQFLQPAELVIYEDEMKRIGTMAGRSKSPLMGNTIHYDQFRPRGHYTRSEDLKRYFRAMMWYGTIAMELSARKPPEMVRKHQLQALPDYQDTCRR